MPGLSSTVRGALRVLAYTAGRAAFLAAVAAGLVLLHASDLPWAGPVFIGAQLVVVALVRYATEAWSKWADEYLAWLDAGDAQAWVAWHREYVTWAANRTRLLGPPPART